MRTTTPNPAPAPASHDPDPTAAKTPITPPRVSPPRFLRPEPAPEQPPVQSPASDATAAGVSGAPGEGTDTVPAGSSEPPPEPRSPKSGSSRASSLVDEGLLVGAIAATVGSIAYHLHELRARDVYDEQVGLYLADEQDCAGVAEPTAKIIGRHSTEIGLAGNPDLADGIRIGIAVTFYVVKQLRAALSARQLRKAAASVGFQHNNDEPTPS